MGAEFLALCLAFVYIAKDTLNPKPLAKQNHPLKLGNEENHCYTHECRASCISTQLRHDGPQRAHKRPRFEITEKLIARTDIKNLTQSVFFLNEPDI